MVWKKCLLVSTWYFKCPEPFNYASLFIRGCFTEHIKTGDKNGKMVVEYVFLVLLTVTGFRQMRKLK